MLCAHSLTGSNDKSAAFPFRGHSAGLLNYRPFPSKGSSIKGVGNILGKGSKIGQKCHFIVVKTAIMGKGVSNPEKIDDVFYGRSLR